MDTPPHPTYESLRQTKQQLTASVSFLRLRWYLKGSVEESIKLLEDATVHTSQQDQYQTSSASSTDGQQPETRLHEVASESITEPPVSSITVTIRELDGWESNWLDNHHPHAEDVDSALYADDGSLIRCCDEDRPGPGPSLLVEAGSGAFVTTQDFAAAVHPWMSTFEAQVRSAKGVFRGRPVPTTHELFLYNLEPSPLHVADAVGAGPGWWDFQWKKMAQLAAIVQSRTAET
ncbi:hypothetical protein CkaCkLH20_08946 [Colletotrichum karsti]|uniref:Uncharacterized protein n=1 Tax=Colletotrichum karsti TaxID=1095194 RepID=A0A9P6I0E1_9PEZI|nr:uncharacterized protein CkaCkLH20_08946 [Colletotrichum karsti]KAF9873487.1 hypothetical protein CkaCkLH20_08946 [Colletotrichum karsti]